MPLKRDQFQAARIYTTIEGESGHLSMITHPQEIADLIIDAAGLRKESPQPFLGRESRSAGWRSAVCSLAEIGAKPIAKIVSSQDLMSISSSFTK